MQKSRNGPQALRERSGAGDGVARGGAPHKTETIFLQRSRNRARNGPQALRGAERCWVRCGAGRGATQNRNSFLAEVSKHGAKRNPGSERSGAALGTVWRGAGRHTKTKPSFSQHLDDFLYFFLTSLLLLFRARLEKNTRLFMFDFFVLFRAAQTVHREVSLWLSVRYERLLDQRAAGAKKTHRDHF